jgi:hypothetical protein
MRLASLAVILILACGREEQKSCDTLGCGPGLRCDMKTGRCFTDLPPKLTLSPVTAVQTQASVEVIGTTSDDVVVSKAEFSIDDGGSWARATVEREAVIAVVPLPALDSKSLSVAVRVFDNANQEADASISFVVDRVGPSSMLVEPSVRVGGDRVTVLSQADDGSGRVASMRLAFNGQSVVMVPLDGGRFSSDVMLPQGREERFPLSLTAADGYGNEATSQFSIDVATRGPAFDLVADGGFVTTTPRPVLFRSALPTFGVSATWRSQPVIVVDAGLNIYSVVLSANAGSAETVAPLSVTGVDGTGTRGSATLMVPVDVIGPAVRFLSPADGSVWGGDQVDAGTITLDVSDTSGVAQVSVELGDDAGFRVVAGPPWVLTVPLPSVDGIALSLRARAVDRAGNLSQTSGPTVLIDTVPPVFINWINPTAMFGLDATYIQHDMVVAVIDRSPQTTVVEVTDYSGTWLPTSYRGANGRFGSAIVQIPLVDYRTFIFSARARDAAGNSAIPLVHSIVVDRVAPIVRFESLVPLVTQNSPNSGASFPVELRSSDLSPGLQYYLRVSGGTGDGVERLVNASSTVTTLATDNGTTYTLIARAVDLVGNQGPPVVGTVVVDRVP